MKKKFFRSGRDLFRSFTALAVLSSLLALLQPTPTFAQGSNCKTSGPVSAAYTLTVCITAPANGASVSGSRTVSATVTVTGTNPGTAKLIFYLGGEYLITDYQSSYAFTLPTKKWVDGSRLLEVEAIMRDGFTSQRASITLNFSNGIVTPPINRNTFTPRGGTTPPGGQAFTVAATGDGADGATDAGNVTGLINSWDPNLFLYLGDVYDDGTATEFYNWYGTSSRFYGRFRSITNPVIGNHEYSSGGVAPGYFDYWDNVPRYYSYDAAGWHFIALDSNCGLVPVCAAGQAQYQWLQNDLSTHSNVCTIAYFHHPVYNVGPEGPTTRMNDIWALLAQYGVDIVMAGHDHNYQRWKPLDGAGAVSASGVTQFVAGGGGHGTQQFITSDSRLVTGFDTTPNAFGALRLQLNQHGAGFQYINTAGTMLDSGSVRCSGAPVDTAAPGRPSGLIAGADSPHLVQLTWTPSTDNVGVTGYSIYRDGILLTTIGPATSYDDAAVQLNTTYSYRIRARDAAGNTSALSSTVTVTTPVLLFSDGFESGNFSQWMSVNGLTVQQQHVHGGFYGARGTTSGTPAYAYEQLSQTENELYYRLWFKILSQGANSIYLQRVRTGSNGALLGVFVSSTGKLSYRNDVAGAATTSTTVVSQGVWHELQTRVLINGTASETEVWLDGTRINSLSKSENLGTTPIGRIQLGDSSTGRTYDVAFDQVALSTQFITSSNPPGSTATPTPTRKSTPTATRTPTKTSTSTPTRTVTPSPAGPGLYDDIDPLWIYSSGWTAAAPRAAYNSTIHRTSTKGTTATFAFRAPAFFTFYYLKGPRRGSFEIWVDGSLLRMVDAYSATNVWQKKYASPTYTDDQVHTVMIKNISPNGKYIDVDAMEITTVPAPAGLGIYDDVDPLWIYSPGWVTPTPSAAYDSTLHRTNVKGSAAMFVFQAPAQFVFYYRKGPNRGTFVIFVDGVKIATINAYKASAIWQKKYTSQIFTDNKSHTVVIKNISPNGTYIDVDAIEIR